MSLLTQVAYPGPFILNPALLAVWAALNRTTNPVNVSQIMGYAVVVAPTYSHQVTGFFQSQTGAPISRTGYALDRASGKFITNFTSSAIDGSFAFYTPSTNPVIIILVPNLGDSRNAIILDSIVPV